MLKSITFWKHNSVPAVNNELRVSVYYYVKFWVQVLGVPAVHGREWRVKKTDLEGLLTFYYLDMLWQQHKEQY